MLSTYQQQACSTFKNHTALTPLQARYCDWGLGIAGEAGEVDELLKHHVFHDAPLDKMKLAKELGDVLWYVAAIATTAEMSLEDIAALNAYKLGHRYEAGFSESASAIRHAKEEHFKSTIEYKILEARILKQEVPVNIIFLGPDGSGKTTIAKELSERLGFTYHKCNYEQPDKVNLANKLLDTQSNVVYDRFYYPDEPVYCGVKDIPLSQEDLLAFQKIGDRLMFMETVFIYVDADMEVLKERSKDWADDYVCIDHLYKIKMHYAGFLNAIEKQRIHIARVDTTEMNIGDSQYNQMMDMLVGLVQDVQKMYISKEEVKAEENANE